MTNQTPTRFKPERPIYLHESNTGHKTKDEVIFAIEKLRSLGWLCCYSEQTRPIHMSFNDENDLADFKKACKDCDVNLISKVIKPEELEKLEAQESQLSGIPDAELKESIEDPTGKLHKIRK